MRQFGKFRLVELLASGGMADVWRAEMPGAAGFVKDVALKLVRGEHREDDAFTRMFIQEARLASRLDHANVVHVFELGQVEGRYYIAMELVRGRTLREVVDRCRELGVRFGVARAVHVCADVARALAYAHRLEVDGRAAGLVHRDVSPQNVLVSIEGEVKLADFGIARAAGADEITRAGTIKGKLAYMAPEQARGEHVDGRADVFALGVILWELCTGRRLFAREGEAATLAALLEPTPVSRPSEWNDAVPQELDAAVLGALERDPERRTSSAEDLAATLSALRLRLAASAPDEIDLRALLRRLWPDGAASAQRPREATAVMDSPAIPVAAEPVAERTPSPDEAQTRTLVYPRPFSAAQQRRRTLSLLAVIAVGLAVTVAVLRLAEEDRRELPRAPGEGRATPGAVAPQGDAAGGPPGAAARESRAQAGEGSTSSAPPAVLREARPEEAAGQAPPTSTAAPSAESSGGERARPAGERSARPAQPRAVLVVDVVPWATVYVDGEKAGDTPLTLELPAGPHEVRAVHPRNGSARARLELGAGERRRWAPTLSR